MPAARSGSGRAYAGPVSRPLLRVRAGADPAAPGAGLPDGLLAGLAAALAGRGPALLPVDEELPPAGVPVGRVPDEVALAVATSGSTGEPRTVLLAAEALRTSARATADRLQGPGRWLLALPVHHVAGLQVLVRSVLAGTEPVALPPGPFRPPAFVAATDALVGDAGADAGAGTGAGAGAARAPLYTSLVPTQLRRLLDDPAALDALRAFDAVLLGGAAPPARLVSAARTAGVPVVVTYGMSETCGGCVYDGVPLDGVGVRVEDPDATGAGRVLLSGPVLALGYAPGTAPHISSSAAARPPGAVGGDLLPLDTSALVVLDGVPHLRTSDLGRWRDGRLEVLGRADDVVVTGGVNVAPAAVERVLAEVPGVAEACVVGVPDDEWGRAVVALVVPSGRPPGLDEVRAAAAGALGPAAAPRALLLVDALPLRGPGKVDRRAAAALAAAAPAVASRRAPVPPTAQEDPS